MAKCKKKKGFTLVELLVVIAIIGILAAVGVTALSGARTKARDAKRVADVKQIQSASELYFNDKAAYPVEVTAVALGIGSKLVLCSGDTTSGFVASSSDCGANLATYMGLVPKDPQSPVTALACTATSDFPCDYGFISSSGTPTSYKIWFNLEGASGGLTGGKVCATQNGMKNATTDAECP